MSHEEYILAASKIISDILGASVTVKVSAAKPAKRMASSSLLSLTFDVNTTSKFTTAQAVSQLQKSIDGGSFATASLTTYGINVVSVMVDGLADADSSKSPQPPVSPLSSSTSSPGNHHDISSPPLFSRTHHNIITTLFFLRCCISFTP